MNVLAILFSCIILATLITYYKVRFPLCLTFLTFFLSLGASPNSFINNADDVGKIVISAALFYTLNYTIYLIPFYYPEILMISSPTFLAFKPRGPNFGANVEAGPASPPKTLTLKNLTYVGSIFGGISIYQKN